MCERTWNFDEPPQENWFGAEMEEGKLYTFVMDCCFPSHGSQQGTTVLVIVDGPEQRCPGYLAKAVPDFMSGCGCGRATLKVMVQVHQKQNVCEPLSRSKGVNRRFTVLVSVRGGLTSICERC